ncbi:MAG: hypothetical protein Greene041679_89 [Parcubacteria group bacterium Greene0416_79]|nr:MAG: hypothetical protein Greene041679_89 [Parcubacteria group bacterium Greene0416_79]
MKSLKTETSGNETAQLLKKATDALLRFIKGEESPDTFFPSEDYFVRAGAIVRPIVLLRFFGGVQIGVVIIGYPHSPRVALCGKHIREVRALLSEDACPPLIVQKYVRTLASPKTLGHALEQVRNPPVQNIDYARGWMDGFCRRKPKIQPPFRLE